MRNGSTPWIPRQKVNLGSSCVSALKLNELFDLIGGDVDEFLKEFKYQSLHYHFGDATGSPRVKAGVCHLYPNGNVKPEQVMMTIGGSHANELVEMGLMEYGENCNTYL